MLNCWLTVSPLAIMLMLEVILIGQIQASQNILTLTKIGNYLTVAASLGRPGLIFASSFEALSSLKMMSFDKSTQSTHLIAANEKYSREGENIVQSDHWGSERLFSLVFFLLCATLGFYCWMKKRAIPGLLASEHRERTLWCAFLRGNEMLFIWKVFYSPVYSIKSTYF